MSTVLHLLSLIPGQNASWAGWAYILLAILVAVEGPVITLAGAVAASTGYLNPIMVFVSAGIGNLFADILWYSLGYLGKTDWLSRYGSKLGINESSLAKLQMDVHTHIRKILFVAKLTLGLVIPTLIAAGLARVPMKRWFGVLFAGECLWTGSLVVIGYYFGYMIQRIETDLRWISLGGTMVVIGLVLYYLYYHRRKLKQES
jgi:membrane protein DedA with SNARE-associated domain